MLGEYTVKRRTLRWLLAFFYNMNDVTGLTRYIIYREHNPRFRAKDQQRKFLKELANMLCMPSIEARSNSRMLMRNHSLRGAVEMELGRCIVAPPENAVVTRGPHGIRGSTPIVGSCCICRDQMRNNVKPGKAVRFADNLYVTNIQYRKQCASFVTMNELFFLCLFPYVINKLTDFLFLIK